MDVQCIWLSTRLRLQLLSYYASALWIYPWLLLTFSPSEFGDVRRGEQEDLTCAFATLFFKTLALF